MSITLERAKPLKPRDSFTSQPSYQQYGIRGIYIPETDRHYMSAQRWHDNDIDLDNVKKDRIAVIGYGIQGRAQANNMKDSGLDVLLGLRRGGKSWDLAEKEGHEVKTAAEATKAANIVHVLVPDMEQS